MTDVIMSDPFDISQPHRQKWLSAVKRLYLAFLVHAQHHGFIGRIQIQPDDIPYLLDKERVCGKLKMALTMRLKTKSSPNPMHGRTRQLSVPGHRPDGPVSSILGFGLNGLSDN